MLAAYVDDCLRQYPVTNWACCYYIELKSL